MYARHEVAGACNSSHVLVWRPAGAAQVHSCRAYFRSFQRPPATALCQVPSCVVYMQAGGH